MSDQPSMEVAKALNMTGKASLYAKIAAVTGEMRTIKKDKQHPTQKWDYASWDAVAQALNESLGKHKLAIIPGMASEMPEPVNVGKTSNGATIWRTYVRIEFTLACGDTGETETRSWWGYADDSSDKGLDKAATYCEKSFMKKLFVISTGDEIEAENRSLTDEDGYQPPERQQERKPKTEKPAPKQEQKPAEKPAPVTGKTVADFGARVKELGFPDRASMTAAFNLLDVPKKDGAIFDIEPNFDVYTGALQAWVYLSKSMQEYMKDKAAPTIPQMEAWLKYMGFAAPYKPGDVTDAALDYSGYRTYQQTVLALIPDEVKLKKVLEDSGLAPWRPEKNEMLISYVKNAVQVDNITKEMQVENITKEIVEQGAVLSEIVNDPFAGDAELVAEIEASSGGGLDELDDMFPSMGVTL